VVGLLARAALEADVLDAAALDALRTLVAAPADLRTAETFCSGPHPVPPAHRRRLVDMFDLFGIAHAVVALRNQPAATAQEVRAVLRQASGVDAVRARIVALGAESRYHRLRLMVTEWETAAITDPEVADLVAGDDVTLTRMTAALDVMRAAGCADDSSDHLDRARRWRRYGAGPVSALHRACAADIVAGSLRLWSPTHV
jgi:hypothetical protein